MKIPQLKKYFYGTKRSKNQGIQVLCNGFEIDDAVLETNRSYITIGNSSKSVCFTCNKNNFSNSAEYVLLTNKKASIESLSSGGAKIKEWIKHPKLINHSPEDVSNSWNGQFKFIEEDYDQGINGLRMPQISALYASLSHLKIAEENGIIVMPTGTGKTETMLSILVANPCKKVLITVPTDALREQISSKFISLGLLKEFGLLSEDAILPKVGIVRTKFADIAELDDFFNSCNVVVATMAVLSGCSTNQQNRISELCSHIFIDEAHHVRAKSWDQFRRRFDKEKVLLFTATPFRNDRKRLDGKIIFNYSLKKAQEDGYFKKINFLTVREYDLNTADKIIAETSVEKLKDDIAKGFNHILMARCANQQRATTVFEFYKEHTDLSPVIIHSNIKDRKKVYNDIVERKHRIIVAVDMLGEGFDMPELKVAAFHDIRKSLPITLQYAGRFTRTKYDEHLGEATFIANLADSDVKEELEELYSQDADWNFLLSSLSGDAIQEEVDFSEFMNGFDSLDSSTISIQNIRTPLSAVVFKNHSSSFNLKNFKEGYSDYSKADYRFTDYNKSKNLLVVITAFKRNIEWGNLKDIFELVWSIKIFYYCQEQKLLFIHDSEKGFNYDIAKAILDDNAEIINQINIFRAFHGIDRITLQNVGLKEHLGKILDLGWQ